MTRPCTADAERPGHLLEVRAVRGRGPQFPPRVQLQTPHNSLHTLTVHQAQTLGAHLIAAAAVASGLLDQCDAQDIARLAANSVAQQMRRAEQRRADRAAIVEAD